MDIWFDFKSFLFTPTPLIRNNHLRRSTACGPRRIGTVHKLNDIYQYIYITGLIHRYALLKLYINVEALKFLSPAPVPVLFSKKAFS